MKRVNKKILSAISIMLCFVFILSACAKQDEAEVVTESVVAEVVEEPEPIGPNSLLTNEASEKDLSKVRPLCVMIENTKAALPHYGLCDAGIVYEAMEEGGITRYMALYDDYDDYDRIGNIRSTRPYYAYIANEFNGILAHVGQSIYAQILLKSMSDVGIIEDINGILGNTHFFRASDMKEPHNAYLSSESIKKDMEIWGIDPYYHEEFPRHFQFAKDENLLEDGEDVSEIHLYFYNNKPYFIYDEEKQLYERYAFGQREPDALSEDGGIYFTNLIIQEVESAQHSDDQYIDVEVMGTGTGKFLTRGKMVDITWQKIGDPQITRYFMEDGTEIQLNTGKTYVALCELSGLDGNSYEK